MASLLGVGGALAQRRDSDLQNQRADFDLALKQRQVATGEQIARTNQDIQQMNQEQQAAGFEAQIRVRQEANFETLLSTMATLQKEKGDGDTNVQNTIDQFAPLLAKHAAELGMSEVELHARMAAAKSEIPKDAAQSNLGKLVADAQSLEKRLGADHPLVKALNEKINAEAFGNESGKSTVLTPAERVEFQIPEGVIAAWQDGKLLINDVRTESKFTLTPTIDDEGNISFKAEVTGSPPSSGTSGGIPSKQQLTGTQLDDLRARNLTMKSARGVIENLLQQPDETFGGTASARKFTEFVGTLSSELLSATGIPGGLAIPDFITQLVATDPQGVDSEAINELRPPTSGAIDVLEATLAMMVARALQPDDRLLVGVIKEAKKITSLQGLSSGKQIKDRLMQIDSLLGNAIGNLEIRMQQGVQGTSDIVAPTVIPGGKADPLEAAIQALEKEAGI